MSITLNKISYIHPDRELLFRNISFSVQKGQKVALIGNNGSGKSTLLQIMAGQLQTSSGEMVFSDSLYYVPQHFGQFRGMTVAEALRIDKKLKALHEILVGDASVENFTLLDEDWNIEERSLSALSFWDMEHIRLEESMDRLSGGEKTRIFLSGISIHSPGIILMDEPTNHLDTSARKKLYNYFGTNNNATVMVVSHDRTLLNLLDLTYELNKDGIEVYGGNYEFYKTLKEEKLRALQAQVDEKEKELRKVRRTARETMERKQRADARGKQKQIKEGVPRIMIGKIKEGAELSAAKLKDVHSGKSEEISNDLRSIRQKLPVNKELKLDFDNTDLHTGKILVTAKDVNFSYDGEQPLWIEALNFQIKSGDRLAIKGANGSGKTTLLKLILGDLQPLKGSLVRADFKSLYVDQEYSLINNNLTVFEQIEQFNSQKLFEHELKTILHRYLFTSNTWDKTCDKLSGGEKMKLVFCCLMVSNNMPDMFILDEPTNNLDIQSLDIVTSTIKDYEGTVLVISHDEYFVKEIGVTYSIEL